MNKQFYVYEWYNTSTNEVFYVGKGTGNRYKNKRNRNKMFLEYVAINPVDVRIVWTGTNEREAFLKEKEITQYYKEKGQCKCSLAEPGYGGCHFVWTQEMKDNWSKPNPMKEDSQRERMVKNNPMKNPDIAKKNAKAHKRAVVIGDTDFEGLVDAAKYYQVDDTTIGNWVRRGVNPKGEKCYYKDKQNAPKTIRCGIAIIVDGISYPSISQAAVAIGVASSSLRSALLEKRKCKGHTCEYANQQPS